MDLVKVSQSVYVAVNAALDPQGGTSEHFINTGLYPGKIAAEISHYHAATICTTGGDKDTGIHCG